MKIVVIGAGVAGLSIAWRLARAGQEVTVLDRAQPGRGATYASAGMIAATAESHGTPEPEAWLALHARSLWPDFAAAIEAESGVDIAFRQDGALIAAEDGARAEVLRAQAGANGNVFLGRDEALRRAPLLGPQIEGALWAPQEAQVDNRALGQALAIAAAAAGVRLSVNEAAFRLEPAKQGLKVLTPFSYYTADAVVVAAGAWSGEIGGLVQEAGVPVRPVKGEMIALLPPEPDQLPRTLIWGHGVYLVPRHGRLFVGATAEEAGFDTGTTAKAQRWLRGQAEALAPALAKWTLAEHWAGLRPGSPDGLPILGETSIAGLFVASGQYRNGILFAPAIAEAMEGLVLGRMAAPELTSFSPRRFQAA